MLYTSFSNWNLLVIVFQLLLNVWFRILLDIVKYFIHQFSLISHKNRMHSLQRTCWFGKRWDWNLLLREIFDIFLLNIIYIIPWRICCKFSYAAVFMTDVIYRLEEHLTLFSKFFASFPEGTSCISNSWMYWILHDIYYLVYNVLPNSVTHRLPLIRRTKCTLEWNLTLCMMYFSIQSYASRNIVFTEYYNPEYFSGFDMNICQFIRHYFDNSLWCVFTFTYLYA